jgi:hypothetical protein
MAVILTSTNCSSGRTPEPEPVKREAPLQRIQQLTIDRVTYAPDLEF